MKKFPPIFSSILDNRVSSLGLSGIMFFQIGATYFHVPGWQCPILHATGIPCPGCGVSRAISILLQGNWQEALRMHAFAPLFFLAFLALAIITFSPKHARAPLIKMIEEIEIRTGVSFVFLVSLFMYWGMRLAMSPVDFIRLINNY